MIKLLKSHWLEILALLAITIIYFSVRIPNLTLQPIFADEAIYIRWAQVMRAEPTLRFLPVSDGKTPLFMWIMIPFFKFISDPLLAGRILAVLSGYLTLLGVLFFGVRFLKPSVGLIAAYFMAITPYIVFFDRIALVDSLLAAFSIWSLNLALLLIYYPRLDLAMILGYLLGAGLLTKPPGFFSILSLPVSILAINWKAADRQWKILKIFLYWLVSLAVTFGIYNILRLGPGFGNINSRNQDYVFSPWELVGRPLDPFIPHFYDLLDIFPKLITWPLLLLIVLGVGIVLWQKNLKLWVVLGWGMIPLLVEMAFLKTFTARYLLVSIPPMLIIAAYALEKLREFKLLKTNISMAGAILLVSIVPAFLMYQLQSGNIFPYLPKSEKGYYEHWTAGYGLKDIAHYLENESQKQPIVVGTQGSFGTLPDGLQIYLDKNRRVTIIGGSEKVSDQLKQAALEHPTYYIANRARNAVFESNLELVREYPKLYSPSSTPESIFLLKVLTNEMLLEK